MDPSKVMRTMMRVGALMVALGAATGCSSVETGGEESTEAEVQQEAPITLGNFSKHPRIVEVRAIRDAIDAAATSGALRAERREELCPPTAGDWFREKYSDGSGAVRKAVFSSTSEHTLATTTLYFSEQGKLRFVVERLEQWIDAQQMLTERRAFLNSGGERFFQVERRGSWMSGEPLPDMPWRVSEGAPDIHVPPEQEANPAQAYESAPRCDGEPPPSAL